jgi:hypothetical protein
MDSAAGFDVRFAVPMMLTSRARRGSRNPTGTNAFAAIYRITSGQQDKLDALQNAVVNSALEANPQEGIHSVFLNFVSELTPSNITILRFSENSFGEPPSWRDQFVTSPIGRLEADPFGPGRAPESNWRSGLELSSDLSKRAQQLPACRA